MGKQAKAVNSDCEYKIPLVWDNLLCVTLWNNF